MKFFKLLILITILATSACRADEDNVDVFPLANYDQNITTWIKPNDPNYDKPLLSPELQQKRYENFYKHIFGSLSPWDANYISQILKAPRENIISMEKEIIFNFTNKNKSEKEISYGENFRPHSLAWIQRLAENMNLNQFDNIHFQTSHRAIAINNSALRGLPTDEPAFYSHKIAGQGYPFDNLQMTVLWAGTPVYVLGATSDREWLLVLVPDCIAWVKSKDIAYTNDAFIKTWETAAQKQLAAITKTQVSIHDDKNQFYFSAYVGAVFPAEVSASTLKLMIPSLGLNQTAVIKYVEVTKDAAQAMPLTATPHQFANIMQTLIGRPYGWGGLYFYNDCSAELKNLLTPFGIWLPKHSSEQVNAGKIVDMSYASAHKRLNYLLENGRPFLTLVYIGGHVFLYVGKHPNPNSAQHEMMAMSYQNVWGLRPEPSTMRYVIGKAVLLPLLPKYPENLNLMSFVEKKYFKISFLDELPNFVIEDEIIDLKALMYPT